MRWLITGGCGFIGTALITKILSSTDDTVLVVDNLSTTSLMDLSRVCDYNICKIGVDELASERVRFIHADIRCYDIAKYCVSKADVVVHLAANTGVQQSISNPLEDMDVNVRGLLNYLDSARESSIKKFIFASSGAVVGRCSPPISEISTTKPVSPYGTSKLAGEAYCKSYYEVYGLNTIALRFSNVYGPGSRNKSSVVAKFIKDAFVKKLIEIHGDGTQTRDFIYIDDLVCAICSAVNSKDDSNGEVFQIATGIESSVQDIADLVASTIRNINNIKVDVGYTQRLSGDVQRNFADINKAKMYLDWAPQVLLKDGIKKTVQYFSEK